eukprot:4084471-Ditylum_brightwellii.AAC.1
MEESVTDHDVKFKEVVTWLASVWSSMTTIQSDVATMHSKLEQHDLSHQASSKVKKATHQQVDNTDCRTQGSIKEINKKLKILESKVSGDHVHLGCKHFPSFTELLLFIKTELPNYCFGLAVDAVSFPEFFFIESSKTMEEVMTSMHGMVKNCFPNMLESRIAAAVQNTLLTVFCQSKMVVDINVHLPGVPSLKHWDTMESTQGLFHCITEELPNAQEQLTTAINVVLAEHTEAMLLCQEFLTYSVEFWLCLTFFIDNFIQRLQGTNAYSDEATWHIISQCVKRILSDIETADASARDIRDIDNPAFTCT